MTRAEMSVLMLLVLAGRCFAAAAKSDNNNKDDQQPQACEASGGCGEEEASLLQRGHHSARFGPLPTLTTTPRPEGPFPQRSEDISDCPINSTEKYKAEWERFATPGEHEKPGCVSPLLYGNFHTCGSAKLESDKMQKAWIFSTVNLEQYMYLQWKFGQHNGSVVTAGAFVIVGFGPPSLGGKPLSNWCLSVFTFPTPLENTTSGLVPHVPVVTYWFDLMAKEGKFFDYGLQQDLDLAYSRGVGNPLDVFQSLTNCNTSALTPQGPADPPTHCSTSSFDVYNDLQDVKHQRKCLDTFWNNADDKWSQSNIGDVRMMIWLCFDANPFNTFNGLGWNSYPNPMVCTAPGDQTDRDHYTGEEFVIDNVEIDTLQNHTSITLATATKESNAYVLKHGFCW